MGEKCPKCGALRFRAGISWSRYACGTIAGPDGLVQSDECRIPELEAECVEYRLDLDAANLKVGGLETELVKEKTIIGDLANDNLRLRTNIMKMRREYDEEASRYITGVNVELGRAHKELVELKAELAEMRAEQDALLSLHQALSAMNKSGGGVL